MEKVFQTTLTEQELRQLIREEVEAANQRVINAADGFIDINGAAEYLKLKASYIYQLVHKTDIPFHKSGKKLLFKKSELESWDQKKKTAELNNQGPANQ